MSYEMIDRFLRNNLDDLAYDEYSRMLDAVVHDAQAEVIKKLAGGVSMEPAYKTTRNARLMTWPGDIDQTGLVVDVYTLSQLQTAVAAARVQENERCAKVCESEQLLGIDDERSYNGMQMAQAIRALIGGNHG